MQDADSMYALGFTDGTVREILCRMMIFDSYLKALGDIKVIGFGRFLSDIFSIISNIKSTTDMQSSRNLNELRDCIFHMYASVPIVDKKAAGHFSEGEK